MRNSSVRTIIALAVFAFGLTAQPTLAYNYAGYRWSGSWPTVVVDSSQIYLIAWKDTISRAMGDWNGAGARFTLTEGSSANKVSTVYDPGSSALATTYISRQWWGGGDVSKVTVRINNAKSFSPPSGGQYDLASVMRHEFGHWLVLNHTNPVSLMQPYYGGVMYLGSDDINAIRAIYGSR